MSEKKEIKLRIPEQVQPGVYANNTMIAHTREEFVLDFVIMAPGVANVVSRVVVSPGHLKRMLSALESGMRKYEANFGPVQSSDVPPVNMGLSG